MAGSGIEAQKVIIRIGMAKDIPNLDLGEGGWDIDYHRLRFGDGTTTPPMIMSTKSIGIFKFDFIDYVEFPQINMLPDGTVDGVDISDLNQVNGLLTRRGNNLWAARTLTNDDGYITILKPDGVAGDPIIDFSDSFKAEIATFLTSVAVDDVTIHGNGTLAAPLHAQIADTTNAGVARLATDVETQTGVSEAIIVTPGGLSSRTALHTRTGVIALATVAETVAGIDDTKAVTPAD